MEAKGNARPEFRMQKPPLTKLTDEEQTRPVDERRACLFINQATNLIKLRSSMRRRESPPAFSHRPPSKCENARPMASDPRRYSCISYIPCLAAASAVAGCE